jgi:hypothetical protein
MGQEETSSNRDTNNPSLIESSNPYSVDQQENSVLGILQVFWKKNFA